MGGRSVLVVDDEEIVRLAVEMGLAEVLPEVACTTCASMSEAIQRLESEDYSLILSDIRMPGGTGLELLDWVLENRSGTPVILMTGFDLTHELSGEIPGALRVVTKPFTLLEIGEVLKEALGR